MKLVLQSGAKLAARLRPRARGAAAASTLLRSLLFGVSPFDPLVLTLAGVSVLLLALTASVCRRSAPPPLIPCRHCAGSRHYSEEGVSI